MVTVTEGYESGLPNAQMTKVFGIRKCKVKLPLVFKHDAMKMFWNLEI